MILTLDSKRRLTLPASLLSAQPGDNFEAIFDPEEDAVIFRRLSKNTKWLAGLTACPVQIDDLPSRRREFAKSLNAVVEGTGLAAAVLNHPGTGVAWLANKIAPCDEQLNPGDVVLSGSFTRPIAAARGDLLHADYGRLGNVTMRFI